MNFALRIPDYYKEEIEQLKGEVSINQFIVNALAEKIASLKTLETLRDRARRTSVEEMIEILDAVPDSEPEEKDRIQR